MCGFWKIRLLDFRAGIALKTSPIERYAFFDSKLYPKKYFNSKKKLMEKKLLFFTKNQKLKKSKFSYENPLPHFYFFWKK